MSTTKELADFLMCDPDRTIGQEQAAAMLRQQAEQIESLKADAERYRWLFMDNKVYSQFRKAYDVWDGCDGKIGFDAAIDEMKGK